MSVPSAQHPVWQRLASGSIGKLKTQHLGIQLMAKRMERASDPLPARAAEIHSFFSKWERVLQAEIQQLNHI